MNWQRSRSQRKNDDDDDYELNPEELLKQENEESSESEDTVKKEVVFEEFVFVRNEMETGSSGKGKDITNHESKLERIHKLRDKARILSY